jgi:hypothetical protein
MPMSYNSQTVKSNRAFRTYIAFKPDAGRFLNDFVYWKVGHFGGIY